jgi:hypothetical protein
MHKGDILLRHYKDMSAEDQRTFDRWLKANLVIGSIVAAGIVAMALAGSNALGPRSAVANDPVATGAQASETQRTPTGPLSAYELMIRMAPDRLPVEQVDEPF